MGCLVVVVGPSGAGKDSVLSASQKELSTYADVLFVQRTITRPVDVGDEGHVSVNINQFMEKEKSGSFAMTWQAHGLYYGVPSDTKQKVNNGLTVVLNGSRGALVDIERVFPTMRVVHFEVGSDILASRLVARARESELQIKQRLARQLPVRIRENCDVVIHNDGALQDAVDSFVAFIKDVRKATL